MFVDFSSLINHSGLNFPFPNIVYLSVFINPLPRMVFLKHIFSLMFLASTMITGNDNSPSVRIPWMASTPLNIAYRSSHFNIVFSGK